MTDMKLLLRLYEQVYRIRRVEEEVARVYPSDQILSPVHLSIGQEAVSAAVCLALQPDDVVFGSYRCHALYLAKGGNLKAMVAELFGRTTGCAKGKAGSMHLIDQKAGVMGASAVVATGIPQAVGYALAMKRLPGPKRLTVCFFGDGAVEEGVFHESVNFAMLHRLPILFICENNGYAIHSRQHARQGAGDICALARAHGLPAERLTDDAEALYSRTIELARAVRSPEHGPAFLEVECYRWKEHVGPGEDYHVGYRDRAELERSQAADQLKLIGEKLAPADKREIEQAVDTEITEAFEFAAASPFPESSELMTDLFAP